jgi:hypothetical protein
MKICFYYILYDKYLEGLNKIQWSLSFLEHLLIIEEKCKSDFFVKENHDYHDVIDSTWQIILEIMFIINDPEEKNLLYILFVSNDLAHSIDD